MHLADESSANDKDETNGLRNLNPFELQRAINNHQNAEPALVPHNQKGMCFPAVPTLF